MKMSPFSAPFFWGTQKREAAAPKPSDCISGGAQEIFGVVQKISWEETEKQKARRCRAQEFGPKQCPEKNERQKKAWLPNWEGRRDVSRGGQLRRNTKKISASTLRVRWRGLDSSGRSDGECRMAVVNALGQGGSNCATAAPLKSPMMAWGSFRGGYFRVADHTETSSMAHHKVRLAVPTTGLLPVAVVQE
jgi:hypothetical protein